MTEANFENAVIEIFRDTLGYNHVYAPDLERDYTEPLFMDELLPALRRVNPTLPEAALNEAVYKLRDLEGGSLLNKNRQFMDYLQNGVSVSYFHDGEQRSSLVYLADYENVDQQHVHRSKPMGHRRKQHQASGRYYLLKWPPRCRL